MRLSINSTNKLILPLLFFCSSYSRAKGKSCVFSLLHHGLLHDLRIRKLVSTLGMEKLSILERKVLHARDRKLHKTFHQLYKRTNSTTAILLPLVQQSERKNLCFFTSSSWLAWSVGRVETSVLTWLLYGTSSLCYYEDSLDCCCCLASIALFFSPIACDDLTRKKM